MEPAAPDPGLPAPTIKEARRVSGAFALQVRWVRTGSHLVTEIEYRRDEPAAIVGLPNAHIPDRDGLCFQGFVHIDGQAAVILREAGFAGVLCRAQGSIEADFR